MAPYISTRTAGGVHSVPIHRDHSFTPTQHCGKHNGLPCRQKQIFVLAYLEEEHFDLEIDI